ncbi:MAG: Crp/Fnr family transcriptional regulator [Anaerolineales bacterium]|nr:Crp/Fnr family transcriptional regulator [Anaerolineales bacterium]
MITQEQYQRISRSLPVLQHANTRMLREFQDTAFYARIPAGSDVFLEGDRADAIALLLSGIVRVYKIGETGREITLYRFGLGESCILTANAILSQKSFPAIAIVEEDAEAVMIPAEAFRDWVYRHDLWREFVFDLLSDRLSTIITIIDEVVFQRMDRRVAVWLIKQSALKNPVHVTHQEIAADLGSSREVISRILEDFSRAGLIETGRGIIEVLESIELEERAAV